MRKFKKQLFVFLENYLNNGSKIINIKKYMKLHFIFNLSEIWFSSSWLKCSQKNIAYVLKN